MKRSEINAIIRDADAFIRGHGFILPPFAYWRPEDWATKGPEVHEIMDHQLGWDITDFGWGDYPHYGLLMFTVRNGSPSDLKTMQGKTYCEKIMVVGEQQVTLTHFHWTKVEDIINRGGGKLAIQLYNSTSEGALADSDVAASLDGVVHTFKAGHIVLLNPGESITLTRGMYHKFWGEGGTLLVGEVSAVNDDDTDNRFLDAVGRFPTVEEDAEPLYLLCKDYARYYMG